ncbi:hypothetical protein B7494_g1989 [Chlorociboria aeruginascens]|nr:hypothetical protein B7494_g1989 [Chlorociboria aeruginascens]
MGWFWGSSDEKTDKDPLRDLDPRLREFLSKESPIKYDSSNPPAPQPSPQPAQAKPAEKTPLSSQQTTEDDGKPKVPPQSLYKDGRYAHLWKTYESQADVEAATRTDQEKIIDVLEGYKYRKAEIGRAALENCAMEQWDVNECFRSGSWASRMTMCRKENQELSRCYNMQAKFLKALGYLSTFDRPADVDEKIQMHADTLYHRMLDQEKQIEAAKAEGKPVPSFPPILSNAKPAAVAASQEALEAAHIDPSLLKPSIQAQFKKRLEGLGGAERELEERAIRAEIQAGEEVVGNLGSIYQKQDEERKKRKDEGKGTFADMMISIFKFR